MIEDRLEQIRRTIDGSSRIVSGAAVPQLLRRLEDDVRWLVEEVDRLCEVRQLQDEVQANNVRCLWQQVEDLQRELTQRTLERDAARAALEPMVRLSAPERQRPKLP